MTQVRTIAALRAARAALGWTQLELAQRSQVALVSITRLEAGIGSPRLATIDALIRTLQSAGVAIIDNQPLDGFTVVVNAQVFGHGSEPPNENG